MLMRVFYDPVLPRHLKALVLRYLTCETEIMEEVVSTQMVIYECGTVDDASDFALLLTTCIVMYCPDNQVLGS